MEIDLSLHEFPAKGAGCLSVPSPVGRTENWRDSFTIYQCQIDADRELASILEPRKKYRIRLASKDLGVKRWAYSNQMQFNDEGGTSDHNSEAMKLVNSKSTAGNATFKTMSKLKWPPRIETRMRLCASTPSCNHTLAEPEPGNSNILEVSVLNTSSCPVTVQTRGHQDFLHPWGIFQPEPNADDDRPRIIDENQKSPRTSSLQIINTATGEMIQRQKQRGVCHLTSSTVDRRPKVKDVVTLKPREPVIKTFELEPLVKGLADGQYMIRMQAKGCRWWHGKIGEEESEDGRVPSHFGGVLIPPLVLETEDEVEIQLRDGKIYQVD